MIIDQPRAQHIPALRALWQEAFGDSEEFLDLFEETAFSHDRARCVTVDGAIAAALYWFDCECRGERMAYLYAIATAKAHRGKGLCSALMEDTHRHLNALGYAGTILVPSGQQLFAFYQRLGYTAFGGIGEIACVASSEKTALRQIDVQEYASLRRKLLPEASVIQEKENLHFLQAQAKLLAGEDFLLAYRFEKDTFFGIELLGNTQKAPAILQTLGAASGKFRILKNEMPFAMYHALHDDTLTPPTYFGLAFD
ncbi:MAG: GNAT family N-acetyltransferase [Clostridia bacterium]|nr:GNAT family N-acetyltransferase [Clostridia bacterium]